MVASSAAATGGCCAPAFDSLVLLISWIIWKERNNRTFSRMAAGVQDLYLKVVREAVDWVQAGFETLSVVCPF